MARFVSYANLILCVLTGLCITFDSFIHFVCWLFKTGAIFKSDRKRAMPFYQSSQRFYCLTTVFVYLLVEFYFWYQNLLCFYLNDVVCSSWAFLFVRSYIQCPALSSGILFFFFFFIFLVRPLHCLFSCWCPWHDSRLPWLSTWVCVCVCVMLIKCSPPA